MATSSRSLSALLKQATIEDHEEIIKACNAALKQSKGDQDAQQIKVIALLKLDRYDEALRVLEDGGNALGQRAKLERAYALYKVGDLAQAQEVANSIRDDKAARHVEAQASYRLEDFAVAAELYKNMVGSPGAADNEGNDIRINSGAVDAQLEWQRQGHLVHKKKPGREDLEAFETAYNAACGCVARGELGQAEILLQRAIDLCKTLDELSDEEKNAELLPIGVQQLNVLIRLGKHEQAEKLASGITLAEIPDLSTRQIAQNNKLPAARRPINPYLSHRLFHSVPSLPKFDKLFSFQAGTMKRNEFTLDLQASKFQGVADSTDKLLSTGPSPSLSTDVNCISVINVAAHARSQSGHLGKVGLKQVLPLLEKRPSDIGLILTIVQLYALTNNHGSAITLLESFFKRLEESTSPSDQDVRFAPGLVAVLTSLYTLQGRKSHIKEELAKAASYWRHKSKPSTALFRAAGLSLLESPDQQDLKIAGDIFDTLREHNPADRFAAAGQVAANAMLDYSRVEAEAEKLTPVNRLTAGIDVLALEEAGIPQIVSTASDAATRKRGLDEKAKPAKKRFRKSRLPKEHDQNKAPDPERWLPLRDRSTYRPKGKKGKQKAAALTQGGIVDKATEGLNMGGADGVVKPANVVGSSSKPKKKKGKK